MKATMFSLSLSERRERSNVKRLGVTREIYISHPVVQKFKGREKDARSVIRLKI